MIEKVCVTKKKLSINGTPMRKTYNPEKKKERYNKAPCRIPQEGKSFL
jgi:hypothetical protein